MKKIKLGVLASFFLFLLFLFFSNKTSNIYAATYCTTDSGNCYVDGVAGLDTNDGKTTTTAWKTIQQAAITVGAGDTVNVKGGITYTGNNACVIGSTERAVVCIKTNAGTAGNPITYKAWPGTGIPVIDVDGVAATVGNGFTINKDYITVTGFEVKDCGTSVANPGGFLVGFSGANIVIANNIVHDGQKGFFSFGGGCYFFV